MNNDALEQLKKETEERLKDLEEDVRFLMEKRIAQTDVLPGAIKQRHISEGVKFVRGGATADKPTKGEGTLQGYAMFYDTTTNRLYVWNSDEATPAWHYAAFT